MGDTVSARSNDSINDIDMGRWRDYSHIRTDSLWIIPRRESVSPMHGSFIPEIPRQMMLRYTRRGEWVLDPFLGSGTTLIECRRQGRNGIGIDIDADIMTDAWVRIEKEDNPYNVRTIGLTADSRRIDLKRVLKCIGIRSYQLLILHPPYYNTIQFSHAPASLDHARSLTDFLTSFGEVLDHTLPYLDPQRYIALVIGDVFVNGELVPLGFYCMREIQRRACVLRGIIIKNVGETRGKAGQKALWRYRALRYGFFVHAHEYIMVLRKETD